MLLVPITVTMKNEDINKTVKFTITESMTAEDIRLKILREKIVHDVGVEINKDKNEIVINYLYDNKYISYHLIIIIIVLK